MTIANESIPLDAHANALPHAPKVKVKRARLIQLDILRGVAVLMVMGFHSPMNWADAGAFKPLTAFFTRFGWAGVDLFFVLSGFLVGGLLFEEAVRTDKLNIPRFLVRRTLKIWPLYFLFLALMIPVLAHDYGSIGGAAHSLIPAFFFYANYQPVPLEHMWSISVEEHFYLLLPLIFVIAFKSASTSRKALNSVAIIGVIAVLAVTITRTLYLWNKPFDPHSHIQRTHWRIDGLFFGVLLAYLFHVQPKIWNKFANYKLPLALFGTLLLVPCMVLSRVRNPFVWTIGYSMLYVGFGAILVAMMHTKFDHTKQWPGIRHALAVTAWIGLNSYPIYLWHLPISTALSTMFSAKLLARFPHTIAWPTLELPYAIIAIILGAWIAKWVERPTLALRDRLFPAKAPAVTPAAQAHAFETPKTLDEATAA